MNRRAFVRSLFVAPLALPLAMVAASKDVPVFGGFTSDSDGWFSPGQIMTCESRNFEFMFYDVHRDSFKFKPTSRRQIADGIGRKG